MVDNGQMVISGTVEVDTVIPLSVNVVEATPVEVTGIVTVTVDGTPTVNILPIVPTVSTVTMVTLGIVLLDVSPLFDVSEVEQYNFYVYADSGTSITALLYNSPLTVSDPSASLLGVIAQGDTLLSTDNSFDSTRQSAILSSDYVANSAFILIEAPAGQTVVYQFVGK